MLNQIEDNQKPEFMSAKELASRLNMSKNSVYRLVEYGQIPYYRLRGSIRFDQDDVNKFLENNYRNTIGM